ncbi:MAG TPA: hypothetical protein VFF31_03965 [Blastocatellia bacterium]|nr:hypothetical protein [Blastocatellia bacterium]
MRMKVNGILTKSRSKISCFAIIVLLVATLSAHSVSATTYISAEPIPSRDVVGQNALAMILSVGYPNLELWSNRLLNDCHIVQNVIDALTSNGAISTVNAGNTRVRVAAGGFEGITDPSYVFTVQDSGPDAVSAADVNVLDNALGYVLNQSGTAHFSPDNARAYDFSLDFAVVTFGGTLTGVQAKGFFDYLGTIDPALWNGQFAGFTQIDFLGSPTNNSMLFLKPATTKQQFISGLSAAASTTPGATYFPLNNNGSPTTAKAGISFPGNDWIAFPNGDQYLARLTNASPQLLSELAALRQRHLQAVANLLNAIERNKVTLYLNIQFRCATH